MKMSLNKISVVLLICFGMIMLTDCSCNCPFRNGRFRNQKVVDRIRNGMNPFFQTKRYVNDFVRRRKPMFTDYFPRRKFLTIDPFDFIFNLGKKEVKEQNINPKENSQVRKDATEEKIEIVEENPNEINIIEEEEEYEEESFEDILKEVIDEILLESEMDEKEKEITEDFNFEKEEKTIKSRVVDGQEVILEQEKKIVMKDGKPVLVEKEKRSIGFRSLEIIKDGDSVVKKYVGNNFEQFDEDWERIGFSIDKKYLVQNE